MSKENPDNPYTTVSVTMLKTFRDEIMKWAEKDRRSLSMECVQLLEEGLELHYKLMAANKGIAERIQDEMVQEKTEGSKAARRKAVGEGY